MRTISKLFLLSTLALITSCTISESDAKVFLRAEAEVQIPKTCDCLAKLEATGDKAIEKEAECKSDGQWAILEASQSERIGDTYPDIEEEIIDFYYSEVEKCNEE